MTVPTVGVLGRFQPFHWGHFEYLAVAAALGRELLVGITNPTSQQTRFSDNDRVRCTAEANPFTYPERRLMIETSLARVMPHVARRFVPCDLRSPRLLRDSLGPCDLVALTIYDEWGAEKTAVVAAAGYDHLVLWRRREKIVSGTDVRARLFAGREWEHLVPPGVADVIKGTRRFRAGRSAGPPG